MSRKFFFLTISLLALAAIVLTACGRIDDHDYTAPATENADDADSTDPAESSFSEEQQGDTTTEKQQEDTTQSELDILNAVSKTAYGVALDVLDDHETMGFPYEQTFSDGIFAKANSADGLETGSLGSGEQAEGDAKIDIAVAEAHEGKFIIYIGLTELNGVRHIFVQTRWADTEHPDLIGQYPDAVRTSEREDIVWTEFHTSAVQPDEESISSAINADERLAELNSAAESAFNCVAEIITDNETQGISTEQTVTTGLFSQSNSADGMEIGFDKAYTSEGDSAVNDVLSTETDGHVSVYLGISEVNGSPTEFVQVRDNDSGLIGQFPCAIGANEAGSVRWTEFYLSDGSAVVNDMQTVNSAAKSAYNLLAEMMADGETRGMTPEQVFEQGIFERANSPEGLATGLNISPTAEGDVYMNELMMYNYSHIAVYVDLTEDGGEAQFFAQVKDLNDETLIGQYPSPHDESGSVVWGQYTP